MHTWVISIVRLAVLGASIGVLAGIWAVLARPRVDLPPGASSHPSQLVAVAEASFRISLAQAVAHRIDPAFVTTLKALDSAYEKLRADQSRAWKRFVEGRALVTKSGRPDGLGGLVTALVVNTVHDIGLNSAESTNHAGSPSE